ncbi:hypothetical protein [Polyangium jinanense]|uniref:Uncharacterized protein n=1 Tax=Polyangium jinanense TaxID=2829994 RepID=A0A9X3WYB9_9BACT|nr:hypothetical protein [Polyangium jinanense]MDC3952780.1 hypothetical protein [Polyangium jinanense]MDC3980399.1 hypothetical protein [Polyangium jinanense]
MADERRSTPAGTSKISPEFRRRLTGFPRGERVRAVVLLKTEIEGGGRRRNRQEIMEATKTAARMVMAELEPLLSATGGHFLADSPDALGSVPVEATPEGLEALSTNEKVRAILEDQPIALYTPATGRRSRP